MSALHKDIRFESKTTLDSELRSKIDQLIFDVWSYEEARYKDVSVVQPEPFLDNPDPLDQNAYHALAWHEDRLVGYARVNIFQSFKDMVLSSPEIPSFISSSGACAFVSRLVVDPDFRRLGVASTLAQMRIEIAKNSGARFVYGCVVGVNRQIQVSKSNFQKIHQIENFRTKWYTTSRSVSLMMLKIENLPMTASSPADHSISLPV
jgi:GNAT superfamily N-acetyltransferase